LSGFLWFTFFTPLAARYHVENAFGLPYVGVHALCLYAGLSIFAISAYPIYLFIWNKKEHKGRNARIEKSLTIANIISIFGCAVRLLSFGQNF
jgi:hypothetical protein